MEHPNLMSPEVQAPASSAPPPRSGWRTVVIVLITALIIVGGAGAGYWAYTTYGPSGAPQETESPSPSPQGEVHVSWQEPEDLGDIGYIPERDDFICDYPNQTESPCPEYFKIGTFMDGPYAGSDILHVLGYSELGRPEYYFVRTPEGGVLLENHSDGFWYSPDGPAPSFETDTDYRIPELFYPTFLEAPYDGVVLQLAGAQPFVERYWDRFDEEYLVKVFDSAYGTVWTDKVDVVPTPTPGVGMPYHFKRYGFYLRAPDNSVVTYEPIFGFMKNGEPSIDWNDGYSYGEYLAHSIGGCGSTDFVAVMPPYVVSMNDLEQAGTSKVEGWPVYELRDKNHPLLQEIYGYYIGMYPQQDTPDGYNLFLRDHPLFFVEDPFGRLVKFRDADYIPLAECGKPVIYLYPETAGWFDVTVEPVGGMSVSDPDYGDGWRIYAEPDGTLTDGSGAAYPYLFWEGTGGIYRTPDRGWVVAREDVDVFLSEKLAELGLNESEVADFEEFWLPRMQNAPWYFVTFLGNRHMDALAPLAVSPEPDTVIRVLMDYIELQEPTDVEPFSIRTPERNGFTVVEWGGVLR